MKGGQLDDDHYGTLEITDKAWSVTQTWKNLQMLKVVSQESCTLGKKSS